MVIDSADAQGLPGAMVELLQKDQRVQGIVSDLSGYFVFSNLVEGDYTVRITFPTYNTRIIKGVRMDLGQVVKLTAPLSEVNYDVGPILIEATVLETSDASAIVIMRNGGQIADIYSGQQVLQSSSGFALDMALARLPGVLVTEETGFVVRSLSERNNLVLLNQIPLQITNMERQAFDFSLLPAGMISRVQLIKSMEPRNFSNFSGGIVQFETPDFPEKNQMTFTYQTGFNTFATMRQTPRYQPIPGAGTPWMFGKINPLPSDFPTAQQIQRLPQSSDGRAVAGRAVNLNPLPTDALAGFNHNLSLRYDAVRTLANGKKLGMIFSLGGLSQHKGSEDRVNIVREFDPELGRNPVTNRFEEESHTHQTGLAAMANFALELDNGKLFFKNLVSRGQMNDSRRSEGTYILDQVTGDAYNYILEPNRVYRQTLLANQIVGEHLLGKSPDGQKYVAKLDWNVFSLLYLFTDPAYQAMNYRQSETDGQYYLDTSLQNDFRAFGTTFSGKQSSRQFGGQVSLTFPLTTKQERKRDFTTGLFLQSSSRRLSVRKFGLFADTANFDIPQQSLHISQAASYYTPENIRPGGFLLQDYTRNGDNFSAHLLNIAPFFSYNTKFGPYWTAQIGARIEVNTNRVNTIGLDETKVPLVRRTTMDLLPMLLLRRSITDKLQFKFVYSRSVMMPDARELSQFEFFNISTAYRWVGNPNLERTRVTNMDLRLEYYPGGSDFMSFSLFTKGFKNPIEQIIDRSSIDVIYLYSLINRERAYMGGAEFEIRKNLAFLGSYWKYINLFANASVVRSRVDANLTGLLFEGRRLQGHSPYLINMGLIMQHPKVNWTAAAFYGRSGNYIAVVGVRPSVFPDFIGLGRHRLDLQVGRFLADRRVEIKLLATDIFNQRFQTAHMYNNRKQVDLSQGDVYLRDSQRGREFILSFSYKF